ncbi:MAG TPA: EAL domain-containing protein, partial [Burkholderiaceae bacterium]
ERASMKAAALQAALSAAQAETARLRSFEQRHEKFMQAMLDGMFFHQQGIITDVNPALCSLLGHSSEALIGLEVLSLVWPAERARVADLFEHAGEQSYEAGMLHRDGTRIPCEINPRSVRLGSDSYRMAVVRDIRDRVAAQARIRQLAAHDSLTQLYNRGAFLERMRPALQRARQGEGVVAVLAIDLDDFRRVNDSLGHQEGDKVLTAIAQRIRGCLRATDLAGRLGSDEFVVLLDDASARADVVTVIEALLAAIEQPLLAEGRELWVTPSIGVALFPEHGDTAEQLIQNANIAMSLAKANGRAAYAFFKAASSSAYADLVIESELAAALERQEFRLHYQPQVSAQDGRLVGVEALLRWQHPTRGLLAPPAFLAVAERHWLMVPLSAWVVRESARQARRWHEAGLAPVRIAVNLSSLQFRLESFAAKVRSAIEEAGAKPAWIELELTERMLMDDIGTAPQTLAELRALGLSVSVDDFGTGHTSMAHLTQLPLDKLKIDQSFVAKLPDDKGAFAISRAIVQMAKGLGLKVTAEGLRNRAQWELLAEWGCDELQGELIGPPMAAEDFEQWLKVRRA